MKRITSILAFPTSLLISTLAMSVLASDFVEMTDEIGRIQRSLLQEDMEDPIAMEEEEEMATTTTTTTTEGPLENMAGPTRFYFENGRLPKFLMEVNTGIRLTLYSEGREVDTFVLDKEAKGGITGSRISNDLEAEQQKDDFRLNLNFKDSDFMGERGRRLSGVDFDINFERKGSEWRMTSLRISSLLYEMKYYQLDLGRRTVEGDAVYAPIGLSYSCATSGKFRAVDNSSSVGVALHFPQWRMQVFEVRRGRFGPEWECGDMISIGLWVGILVTLGFALICAWGFSMLASINTMDRFDDPKGKTIHIPQTAD